MRLVLSEYANILIHDEVETEEDEYDPFCASKTEWYNTCVNDSIIKRAVKIYLVNEFPEELFANPHSCVEEAILYHKNYHTYHKYIFENPNDRVIDFVWARDPLHCLFNANPRAVLMTFEAIKQNHIQSPELDKISFWKRFMSLRYATSEMVEYAEQKLREFEFTNDEITKCRYEMKVEKLNMWNMSNMSNMFEEKWFVEALFARDFETIFTRLDGEGVRMEIYTRLAKISDSDVVARWLMKNITNITNMTNIPHFMWIICQNPHSIIVDYFLNHPKQIDWSGWIKNPNPRTLTCISHFHGEEVFVNATLYIVPHPIHMCWLMDWMRTNNIRIGLSTLLESLSHTNDVEIIFDVDTSVEFLNGKVDVFPSSMTETQIEKMIQRREGRAVKLVNLNDDNDEVCNNVSKVGKVYMCVPTMLKRITNSPR